MKTFTGTVAFMAKPTVDGRQVDTLDHRVTPLPVTMVKPDASVHAGAFLVGYVHRLTHHYDIDRWDVLGNIVESWAIELLDEGGWCLQAEMDGMMGQYAFRDPDGREILGWGSARLSSVHLGQNPAWPGTQLRWVV